MELGGSAAWVIVIFLMGLILAAPAAAEAPVDVKAAQKELAELNKQDTLSSMFRLVAKIVRPAVVEVRVTKWVKEPDIDELFKRFFGEDDFGFRFQIPPNRRIVPIQPRRRQLRGLGSGVIVNAAEGYVLTNYHVVAGADEVEVVLEDGRKFEAEKILPDPQSDLAIIKIKGENLTEAVLGDSSKMEVGDWVLAIGAPRGLRETVTAGIISAKGRMTNPAGGVELYQDFIQTDAAINQGNSGGPLVNMRAEVIGINNSIVTSSGGNEGIGFAIPSNMARNILTQLVEKGKVVRGFLGVRIQNIDNQGMAESLGLPNTEGALVADVGENTPASEAGLKPGDVIVKVDGKDIVNANELRNDIARLQPGKTVPIELYRDGKKKTLDVKIAVQPKEIAGEIGGEGGPVGEAPANRFGLQVATMTKELAEQQGYKESVKGVLITDVDSGSDADEQGLRPGMVILSVDGKGVTTAEEFNKFISSDQAKNGIRLRIADPAGNKQFVFIQPTKPKSNPIK
jgi:serine protease Do